MDARLDLGRTACRPRRISPSISATRSPRRHWH